MSSHRYPHLRNAEVECLSVSISLWCAALVFVGVRLLTRSRGYTP